MRKPGGGYPRFTTSEGKRKGKLDALLPVPIKSQRRKSLEPKIGVTVRPARGPTIHRGIFLHLLITERIIPYSILRKEWPKS